MLALQYCAVGNKEEKNKLLSVKVRFTRRMSKTFKWKFLALIVNQQMHLLKITH